MKPSTYSGRHLLAGMLFLGGGIIIASMIPFLFTLPKNGGLVGLLLFGPLATYMLIEAVRRLTLITIELSASGVRCQTSFRNLWIPWDQLVKIRADVERNDECRIILTLYHQSGKKFRIPQGTFSIPTLDEIISTLKEQVGLHPGIEIDEHFGIWSGWERFVENYNKLPFRGRKKRG